MILQLLNAACASGNLPVFVAILSFYIVNLSCVFDLPSWPVGVASVNPQLEMANILRFGTTSSPLQISAAGRAQVEEEFGKEHFFFLPFLSCFMF